jgi:hypothetical protein
MMKKMARLNIKQKIARRKIDFIIKRLKAFSFHQSFNWQHGCQLPSELSPQ